MHSTTIAEMGFINPLICSDTKSYNFIKDQLRRNKWLHTDHPEHGSKRLIDYNSIPVAHKVKLGLPLEYSAFKKAVTDYLRAKETEYHYEGKMPKSFHLVATLKKYIEQNYLKYISMYAASCNNDIAIAERYSREHALRNACVQHGCLDGITVRALHEAYLSLSQTGTQNNYYKFSSLLKHQWTNNDGICLIHGHTGKNRPDIKKLSNTHIALIEELYKHPNQYSHNLITELLNNHCTKKDLPTVCRRSVSKYLQQPDVYNRLLVFRNKEAYGKKIKPIIRRKGALNAGDLYYMDGSPSQIPCLSRDGAKEIRPTIFIAIDSYSRKVTGFCIAETEDRYTWFGAMNMAIRMENSLPAEWVYDNASATGTPEFKALADKLLLNGSKLRAAKPGEPTAKAQVERWFGSFQNGYQRIIEGFTGEGIRSKRETGRIDAEFLKKVRKQNGVFTFDSLVEILSFLIAAYNQKGTPKHRNPSKKFAESSKPNTVPVAAEQIALLFWNNRPITIRSSEVKMTIRHTDYFYAVNDYTLNGQTVKVYYDEADLSNIHLFDNKDQYICEVKQKILVHEAQINQSETDRLQIMGQQSHKAGMERRLIKDGRQKTQAAKTEFGDDYLKTINPLSMLKDDYNTAETELVLTDSRERHRTNATNIAYTPLNEEDGTNDISNRFAKKYTVSKPSLAVIE